MPSKPWKMTIKWQKYGKVWLCPSFKVCRLQTKLWTGEAVCVWQHSFVIKILFSKTLMLFMVKNKYPRLKWFTYNEKDRKELSFWVRLHCLIWLMLKTENSLYNIAFNAFLQVVLGIVYCEGNDSYIRKVLWLALLNVLAKYYSGFAIKVSAKKLKKLLHLWNWENSSNIKT